ncbi:ABC transporter substrate-binding protein [Ensifer sesbaniae]|uniref:ABC transporter substrate-binding protein n=1 Tax=Ensifer sesbaniae TaxID=1214071 RepID=UPI002001B40A|nr:ABC transporter substrate-binding protein [Ensifer sesbaniae]
MSKSTWLSGLVVAGAMAWGLGTAAADPIRIGIANFGEHPQLNASIAGFKKALAENGFVEGQKALAGSGIPVVFSAVTDPVAAKLVPSWEAGDDGMTGATDLQDVAAVMAFTRKLLPEAKRFGVPYNPGEANDTALLDKIKEAAPAAGFEVVEVGVDNVNDIQQRIASFAGKADVIYTPASNLLQPAIGAVSAAARQAQIPIVNSDDGAVRDGVVPASFAVNYEQVGVNAGKIAAEILKGTDPKTIAPSRPAYEDHAPLISKKATAAFSIEVPAALAGECNCVVD